MTLRDELKWIEQKPLWGKRFLVTRNQDKSHKLRKALSEVGAEVLEVPTIAVQKAVDSQTLTDVWSELPRYDWIAFTSANGVEYFFEEFYNRFKDLRCLGPMQVACIGKATQEALEAQRLEVDIIPETANAEALAAAMLEEASLENTQSLLIQGNRNDTILSDKLVGEGQAIVDTLQVYETLDQVPSESKDLLNFRKNGADAIIFTSSSAVESFAKQAEAFKLEDGATQPKIATLGPKTSETVKKLGAPRGSRIGRTEHRISHSISHKTIQWTVKLKSKSVASHANKMPHLWSNKGSILSA